MELESDRTRQALGAVVGGSRTVELRKAPLTRPVPAPSPTTTRIVNRRRRCFSNSRPS